jgi:hypothetical protein
LRFGFEWQFDRSDGFLTLFEPAAMVLYSPQIVQAYNADPRVPAQARIPIPSSFDGGTEKWGHYGREKGASDVVTLWPAAGAMAPDLK